MKMSKIMLAVAMVLGTSTIAHAADDQGSGKVTFTGSIIDAPCSIAPESEDQVVDLGQVSSVALKDMGKSNPRDFDIKLEQCDTETMKTVSTTFSGAESANNSELLGIAGTASGAGVAISYGGDVVKLGEASQPLNLIDGDNTIHFAAYLQGESESATIVPGDFSAVANWTLDYQ